MCIIVTKTDLIENLEIILTLLRGEKPVKRPRKRTKQPVSIKLQT